MKTLLISLCCIIGGVAGISLELIKFSTSSKFELQKTRIHEELEFPFGPSRDKAEDDGEWYFGPQTITPTSLRK